MCFHLVGGETERKTRIAAPLRKFDMINHMTGLESCDHWRAIYLIFFKVWRVTNALCTLKIIYIYS